MCLASFHSSAANTIRLQVGPSPPRKLRFHKSETGHLSGRFHYWLPAVQVTKLERRFSASYVLPMIDYDIAPPLRFCREGKNLLESTPAQGSPKESGSARRQSSQPPTPVHTNWLSRMLAHPAAICQGLYALSEYRSTLHSTWDCRHITPVMSQA